MDLSSKYLLFHGSVVLLAGLLSGAPMGSAINKKRGEATIQAWRVSHSGLVMGGLMMLVIAVAIPNLSLTSTLISIMVWSLVISGYGFTVALPLGAWKGHRGLKPNPSGINRIVYGGNIIGAGGSLVGALLLLYGSWNVIQKV